MNRMTVSALLLVFWAMPALGYGTYLCADNDTSCDPYGTALVDDSGSKNSPTQWYGGQYYYCSAESRWGQLCWDSVVNPETNKLECRQVNSSAHCGCHKTTFETIGMCDQKH